RADQAAAGAGGIEGAVELVLGDDAVAVAVVLVDRLEEAVHDAVVDALARDLGELDFAVFVLVELGEHGAEGRRASFARRLHGEDGVASNKRKRRRTGRYAARPPQTLTRSGVVASELDGAGDYDLGRSGGGAIERRRGVGAEETNGTLG